MDRHVVGGAHVASKSAFPASMSEQAVEAAVRGAYRVGQRVRSQGDRVLVRGQFGGFTIEMWVNRVSRLIETAYPVF
jgi:hypothetical protein